MVYSTLRPNGRSIYVPYTWTARFVNNLVASRDSQDSKVLVFCSRVGSPWHPETKVGRDRRILDTCQAERVILSRSRLWLNSIQQSSPARPTMSLSYQTNLKECFIP